MTESEISLKIAELALSKSQSELWDDIVKIGFPSLIALVGIISTYLLTKSGQQKDLKIEKIRTDFETQKEINTRTGDLVKSISIGLSDIHKKMLRYTSNLDAKLTMDVDNLPYSKEFIEKLSNQYESFVDSLEESFTVEALIMLLGKHEIDQSFLNYQTGLSELSRDFPTYVDPKKYPELRNKLMANRDLREELFKLLSEVYLINNDEG